MEETKVFILAEQALRRVVDNIRDGQWDMLMPPEFMRRDKKPVTLREIINYHAYDDAWVPDMLSGKTMEEAGKDKYDGDLLGDSPAASFGAIVDKAVAAARDFNEPDKTVHLSFGDFKAKEYFWQINLFRGLRAYDIAKVIGAEPGLPDELVKGIWDEVSPHAEEWRAIGVFGPAVEAGEGADQLTKLLALTGRNP